MAHRLRTDQTETVLKNIRLAAFFARKYRSWSRLNSQYDLKERIQAAKLGICEAAARFDPSRSIKFTSYAHHWIRHALQKTTDTDHPVKIPEHMQLRMQKILSGYRKFRVKKGEESALQYLMWAVERYNAWSAWSMISHGKVEVDNIESEVNDKIEIENFDKLTPREQAVIRFRYGINTEPRSLSYIGENILGGISGERVRQIEAIAIGKLRGKT